MGSVRSKGGAFSYRVQQSWRFEIITWSLNPCFRISEVERRQSLRMLDTGTWRWINASEETLVTDRVMEEGRGAGATATVGPAAASCSSRSAATGGAVDADADHHQQVQPSQDHGSWLCCVPCYWLRWNNSLHKASLTVATLVVMSLLVASPVIFLISGVPAREGDRIRECVHQVGAFDFWPFLILYFRV